MLRNLFVHASRYSLAGLAVTFAGLISFPILTRMLSVSDYGLLSLVMTTIFFIAAFGKAGLQFSIVRYYSDAEASKGPWDLNNYYSTLIIGMVSTGIILMLMWVLLVYILPADNWSDPNLKGLFLLTAILIFAEVMLSMLTGFLQAQQNSTWLSIFRVVERYSIVIFIVFTLYFISQSLEGVLLARVIIQLIVVSVLAYFILRRIQVSRTAFSGPMFKEMLLYGVPLLGNELVFIVLNLGDRYLIQWLIGSEPLGIYAASYNLCEYVKVMLVVALFQAIRPMYFKLWDTKGAAETEKFVEKSLYFYLMVACPVVAGISLLGPDLLVLVTSGKYASGAVVIPYIIGGLMIYGAHSMLSAGIFIQKSTVILWTTLAAAILNVSLNTLLIPRYGIEGAAQATLLSYLFMTIIEAGYARRLLRVNFPFWAFIRFSLLGLVMYFILQQIQLTESYWNMLAQIICGVFIYLALLFICDTKAKGLILERLRK